MDARGVRETALRALSGLGRLPSVPYYEHRAVAFVRSFCEQAGLEVQADRWGNVLACRPGTSPDAPGLAFVAHLDHPGFEAVEDDGRYLVCRALGGIPQGAVVPETKLLLLAPTGRGGPEGPFERIPAEVVKPVPVSEDAHDQPASEREVLVRPSRSVGILPCAVVFDLPDFDLDHETITMRALDDLAGCASVLAALKAVSKAETPGPVYGLFTRAEEVGLIGARLAAADGLLPKNTVVVSVESSRTLPGAEIGKGPVIRVGDARTTFDNRAEAYLVSARDRLAARAGAFPCQRQLMSEGTCEGTAFSAFGYMTTAVAYPLGNYHNAGPDGRVAAEYIALADFAGGAALLAETASLAGTNPVTATGGRIRSRPSDEARRLSGADGDA